MQQTSSLVEIKALKNIPGIRRHVYFYLLLFLGANLLTSVWRNSQPVNEASEEIERIERTVSRDVTSESVTLASNH